jgi:hypothetical protein
MDVLAHMLWTNYGSRVANKKLKRENKRPINLPWVTFWGVFPDLFAFGIPISIAIIRYIFNGFSNLARPDMFGLPLELYNYSHSLVIWAFVFLVVWIILKRPCLELLGWALHILIDIPSHVATFYPTPFLFPVSNFHFTHGISWGNQWYMVINYSLLFIASIYFFSSKRKTK